jgi:Asp-tRNA(Asn)/Glu-tRNA(Gln) amidotransferase C subunit
VIKEIELEYTVNNLAKLSREKWGDNAVEYLVGALDSVITYNQMKVLIDFLSAERTYE